MGFLRDLWLHALQFLVYLKSELSALVEAIFERCEFTNSLEFGHFAALFSIG